MANTNPSAGSNPTGSDNVVARASVAIGADTTAFQQDAPKAIAATMKQIADKAVQEMNAVWTRAKVAPQVDLSGLKAFEKQIDDIQTKLKALAAQLGNMPSPPQVPPHPNGPQGSPHPTPTPNTTPTPPAPPQPTPNASQSAQSPSKSRRGVTQPAYRGYAASNGGAMSLDIHDFNTTYDYLPSDRQKQLGNAYQSLQVQAAKSRQAMANAASTTSPAQRSAVEQKLSGELDYLANKFDSVSNAAVREAKALKDAAVAAAMAQKAAANATAAKQQAEAEENAAIVKAKRAAKEFREAYDLDQSKGKKAKSADSGGDKKAKDGGGSNRSYGLLMLGQTLDDAQCGFKRIVKNMHGLVMALGGGAGLAGVLSITGIAVNQFGGSIAKAAWAITPFKKELKELASEFGLYRDKLTDIRSGLAGMEEHLKAIQDKPIKLTADYKAIEELEKRIAEVNKAIERWESLKGSESKKQASARSLIEEGIKEGGGAKLVEKFITDALKRDGRLGEGKYVSGSSIPKEIEQENKSYNALRQTMNDTGQGESFNKEHQAKLAELEEKAKKEVKEYIAEIVETGPNKEVFRKELERFAVDPKYKDLRQAHGLNNKFGPGVVMASPENIKAGEENEKIERKAEIAAQDRRANEDRVQKLVGPVLDGAREEIRSFQLGRIQRGEKIDTTDDMDLQKKLARILKDSGNDFSSRDIDTAMRMYSKPIGEEVNDDVKKRAKKEEINQRDAARDMAKEIEDSQTREQIERNRRRTDQLKNPLANELNKTQDELAKAQGTDEQVRRPAGSRIQPANIPQQKGKDEPLPSVYSNGKMPPLKKGTSKRVQREAAAKEKSIAKKESDRAFTAGKKAEKVEALATATRNWQAAHSPAGIQAAQKAREDAKNHDNSPDPRTDAEGFPVLDATATQQEMPATATEPPKLPVDPAKTAGLPAIKIAGFDLEALGWMMANSTKINLPESIKSAM